MTKPFSVSEPYISCCPTCFVNMRHRRDQIAKCPRRPLVRPESTRRPHPQYYITPKTAYYEEPRRTLPGCFPRAAHKRSPKYWRDSGDFGFGLQCFRNPFPQKLAGFTLMHNMPPSDWCRIQNHGQHPVPDYWRGSETGGGAGGLLSCNYNTGGKPTVHPHSELPPPSFAARTAGMQSQSTARWNRFRPSTGVFRTNRKTLFRPSTGCNNRFPPSTGVSGSHHQTFFPPSKSKKYCQSSPAAESFAPSKAGIRKQSRAQ